LPQPLRRLSSERPASCSFGLLCVVVLLLLALPSTPASASTYRLSPSGLGPIQIGMSPSQARVAAGPIQVENGINSCSFWSISALKEPGYQLIAFSGRLSYILLFQRGVQTSRRIKVGDGLTRLRHRYRGKLHSGRSASLSGAEKRLFVTERRGGATYELEFDIYDGKVAFISAGTQHVIETFGECA
jgi:hypothetical protein